MGQTGQTGQAGSFPLQVGFFSAHLLYVMVGFLFEIDPITGDSGWNNPGVTLVGSYIVFTLLGAAALASLWMVGTYQTGDGGQEQVNETSSRPLIAWLLAPAILLSLQSILLGWHQPDESIAWMVTFSAIGSGICMAWMWISVGYSGMYRPGRRYYDPGVLLESLKHELDVLRTILLGLVVIYGLGIGAVLVGFDTVETMAGQGAHQKIWFISGAGLLLFTLQLGVTGPIFSRYMSLVKEIRESGSEQEDE